MIITTIERGEVVPNLDRQTGTATIVAGTGKVVTPIADLLKLSPDQLADFVEALGERENLFAMATMGTEATGIHNTLYMIPVPEGQHGPRIKVMIDPSRAKRPGSGTEATVPFDAAAKGAISSQLERQVRDFIALNRAVLEEYWRLDIYTDQLFARLRPIKDS